MSGYEWGVEDRELAIRAVRLDAMQDGCDNSIFVAPKCGDVCETFIIGEEEM